MANYLLTGAGFSRNWGAWLASEVFEYLLGCDLPHEVLELLWRERNFEVVLGKLRPNTEGYMSLTQALFGMFSQLNHGLSGHPFGDKVQSFLGRFDAIFTLNQDLLLEMQYRGPPFGTWYHPGVQTRPGEPWSAGTLTGEHVLLAGQQPYFKLHGSSNFTNPSDNGGAPLLIMGADKNQAIDGFKLLSWYRGIFAERLGENGARLVVIGYSFADRHITSIIQQAATTGLEVYIIDPSGVDVLDEPGRRDLAIYEPSETMLSLQKSVKGASRRAFRETFGEGQSAEHAKIMRFLAED